MLTWLGHCSVLFERPDCSPRASLLNDARSQCRLRAIAPPEDYFRVPMPVPILNLRIDEPWWILRVSVLILLLVEPGGIEPPTSTLPVLRSPS